MKNPFAHIKAINIKNLKKLSGLKTLECGFDLADSGVEFLKYSILSENPKLSWAKLKGKMQDVLCPKR